MSAKRYYAPAAVAAVTVALLALPNFIQPGSKASPEAVRSPIVSGQPVFLEFYSDHCPTCDIMAPGIKNLEREFGGKIKFMFVNIDRAGTEDLARKFDVFSIPAIHLIKKDGTVSASFEGSTEISTLRNHLKSLL